MKQNLVKTMERKEGIFAVPQYIKKFVQKSILVAVCFSFLQTSKMLYSRTNNVRKLRKISEKQTLSKEDLNFPPLTAHFRSTEGGGACEPLASALSQFLLNVCTGPYSGDSIALCYFIKD